MEMANKKILAIDDEHVILDAIEKICSLENITADKAGNIKTAFDKLGKNKYDLIICDIMMPDGDGFEMLGECARRKIKTPVIISSGYSTMENAVKSLVGGAIDFIPKPFTADELLNALFRGFRYSGILYGGEKKYLSCPRNYYFLGYSTWAVAEEDGSALCGATDLFMEIISPVDEISLASIDEEIFQGMPFCRFTSKNGLTHELLAPISGRIIERNEEAITNVEIVENSPFDKGNLYRIIPTEMEYDFKNLKPCNL